MGSRHWFMTQEVFLGDGREQSVRQAVGPARPAVMCHLQGEEESPWEQGWCWHAAGTRRSGKLVGFDGLKGHHLLPQSLPALCWLAEWSVSLHGDETREGIRLKNYPEGKWLLSLRNFPIFLLCAAETVLQAPSHEQQGHGDEGEQRRCLNWLLWLRCECTSRALVTAWERL